MSIDEVLNLYSTDLEEGLNSDQVKELSQKYGLNELSGNSGVSPWKILLRQVANILTVILVIAMAIAFASQDWVEGGVIGFIIITNATIGFMQEYRAEKTMESLRRLASPTTNVIRSGHRCKVSTNQLVPGDIIILENGDVVGADARVVEQFNLSIDEALLTGESVPVEKTVETIIEKDAPVGDRTNLTFSSTTVTRGRGTAIVVATGMDTEIGKIARTLNDSEGSQKTSLQKTMDRMALAVFGMAILLAIIVFSVNSWVIEKNVAIYAVAVSIAIIPEGLIAVITLTMAAGVRNMAKNRAIIRQLTALETLGSVTNICSDKTGTLTQAKMVLTRFWLPGYGYFSVTGAGYNPIGDVLQEGETPDDSLIRSYGEGNSNNGVTKLSSDELTDQSLRLVQVASLCNMAKLKKDKASGEWIGLGDPTENALQAFAHKFDMGQPNLIKANGDHQFELLAEFPFDSSIKLMTVVYLHYPTQKKYAFTKGAMERVLEKCNSYLNQSTSLPIDSFDHLKNLYTPHMEHLASQGLRTLCTAYRDITNEFDKTTPGDYTRDQIESNLTAIGLVGIYDPPRPESRSSVLECHKAGISVHMLTGDHPATATAIARDVGIVPQDTKAPGHTSLNVGNNLVMTAQQFDALSEEEIDNMVELPNVIARCSPDTKVKMIRALHRRNRVAAMTGDGVNDSPSLKIANVGIGMGLSGSDVAKQASDIVLTDDNFATIVKAVEEGRRIFENIVKFVLHLMSGNASEIVALVIGLCFTDNAGKSVFPMSPIQILFLNMITSSPPAMGLGLEPAHKKAMLKPPRPVKGGLFTWEVILDIMYFGLIMGGLALINFVMVVFVFGNGNLGSGCNDHYSEDCELVFRARAASYACLTLLILLHAFNCRSLRQSSWSMKALKSLKNNRFLLFSVIFGALLLIPAIYIPGLNHEVFRHAPIDWEWIMIFISCIVFLILSEGFKWFKRSYFKSNLVYTEDDE
ncbi:Na P-type ATPase [Neoconidiobolus thromboides FSU 785]|nr:Na P-type ATPase [Neoconidiobolus thromboides FSU 785]